MKETRYSFTKRRTQFIYDFVSISDERKVKKIVALTATEFENVFNLALLDILEDGSTSDSIETRNGDMRQIMATIFDIIADFLTENPESWVIFRGSDEKRHRLYRVIITREIELIKEKYEVFGQTDDGKIEPFEAQKNYVVYAVKRRNDEN